MSCISRICAEEQNLPIPQFFNYSMPPNVVYPNGSPFSQWTPILIQNVLKWVSIFCPVRIPVSDNCVSRLCTDISGFAESGAEQDYVCKRENSGVFSTNEQRARRPLCGQTAYGDCQCDPMPNLYTHGLSISCNETQKNAQSKVKNMCRMDCKLAQKRV